MFVDSRAEIFPLLDNPLLTENDAVIGWLDAGSVAQVNFPISEAYDVVTREVSQFGFVDTMTSARNGDIDVYPSHASSVVRDVLTDYHEAVKDTFVDNWQKIQTTMRLEKIIEKSANSTYHVDGVSVRNADYVYSSAQKIIGITAHPNPTEFIPRGTIIPGALLDIFLGGNIRNPELITSPPVSHPGKIALFGYSESFHREPPASSELLGQPRLILRSFVMI